VGTAPLQPVMMRPIQLDQLPHVRLACPPRPVRRFHRWKWATSAARVGPKFPYRRADSVSTLALTVSGICRFEGVPHPRCTRPA
jgi:hypothetical protein